ncbi:hypothetical protein HY450_02390 [Candidatus Pacearchaeota archaeon]|nr:hypothetical protein [Candidatus Pacearchaeota archaeon]
MKTKVFYIGMITVLVMFFLIFYFGNFNLRNAITGRLSSRETNASISVVGVSPVTITVFNGTLTGATVDPTEDSNVSIVFYAVISDNDGAADINTTFVRANFSRTGEAAYHNNSCSQIGANLNTTSKNFSCTINMPYFASPLPWNVRVMATDLGNKTFFYNWNDNSTFTYAQLQAIQISHTALTWPSVAPGDINQSSNNDPTIINNTGNYNITNLTFQGFNLYGATSFINVANITISNSTGLSVECNPSNRTAGGTNVTVSLVNGTNVQIPAGFILRNDHTSNNNETGQEALYYCITTVPSNIPSETYSTTKGWVIKLI